LIIGPSSRGGIALFKGARALAFIQGRDFVIPDDVKKLVVPALCHRLPVSAEAEMERVTPEAIIKQVISAIPVPKGEAVSSAGETGTEAEIIPGTATISAGETVNPTAVKEETENKEPLTVTPDEAANTDSAPVQDTETEINTPAVDVSAAPVELRKPSGNIFSDWQLAIVILAVVVAIIMICLGLLSIR